MQLVARPVAGTGHGVLGRNVFGGVIDEVNLVDLGDATGRTSSPSTTNRNLLYARYIGASAGGIAGCRAN